MPSKVVPLEREAELASPPWETNSPPAAAPIPFFAAPDPAVEPTHPENPELLEKLARAEENLKSAVAQARADCQRELQSILQSTASAQADSARKLTESIEALLAARQTMRRQMEEELVSLAVVVARRILRRELSVDPTALSGIVRAAIDQLETREIRQLRISQQDAESLGSLPAAFGLPAAVRLVPDTSLARGSVVFETTRGTLDASIDVQLQEIEHGFADLLRRTP